LSEPPTPDGDLFHEETDDPLLADRRNFFKVELWTRDGLQIERLLFAGNSLDKQLLLLTFIAVACEAMAAPNLRDFSVAPGHCHPELCPLSICRSRSPGPLRESCAGRNSATKHAANRAGLRYENAAFPPEHNHDPQP
jgi:hypothetical protein